MIREATISDLPRVIGMATRFILTTRTYRDLFQSPNPERITQCCHQVLEHGVIFLAEKVIGHRGAGDGSSAIAGMTPVTDVVGMLAMLGPLPHLLIGQSYAEEIAWWVEPEHRFGTIGPRLLHHMECWCRQKGVYMVKMLAPADSDVGAFYHKCGYQAVETAWVKVFS